MYNAGCCREYNHQVLFNNACNWRGWAQGSLFLLLRLPIVRTALYHNPHLKGWGHPVTWYPPPTETTLAWMVHTFCFPFDPSGGSGAAGFAGCCVVEGDVPPPLPPP